MRIACIAFLAVISLVNVIAGIYEAIRLSRKKILSCDGLITTSRIGQSNDVFADNTCMYWAEVEFQFVVSGHTILGNRISYWSIKTSDQAKVAKQLTRYPPGALVRVFYNADKPEESYLQNPKKHIATNLAYALGVSLMTFGLCLLCWRLVQ